MASVLYQTIENISRDKGIDPQIVVSAVEDAIVVATRKYYKSQENLKAELDKESGAITAWAVKTVVADDAEIEDPNAQMPLTQAQKIDPKAEAGGEVRIYKPTDVLGRIAAQLAKQVIFQKVREAERDTVFQEYNGRVGEILNATIKRVEGPDVIVDIGKTEGRMGKKEQSRLESFAIGERVRVVLVRVDRAAKGPQVVVSRAAPELVQNLFQTEVPEIYDSTVQIRAIAREAGELLGWKIEIKSEEEKRQEVEQQMSALVTNTNTPLENVPGLGESVVARLREAGVTTVESLADMTPEQLEEIPGIGEKTVEKISIAVNDYFSR